VGSRRVLITGGAGFIGSRLARLLAAGGDDVVRFDNLHPQVHGVLRRSGDGTGLVVGDVGDAAALAGCVRYFNPEIVYHLAAETGTGQSHDEPARYNHVNVMGTAHLVEAVRSHGRAVRRLIVAGSRAVYGEGAGRRPDGTVVNGEPRRPEDMQRGDFSVKDATGAVLEPVPTPEWLPPMPASVYASTKLMQEHLLTQCFAGTAVDVAILRLQNVYGPGQSLSNPYTGVISIFAQQIEQGRRLNIFEDGDIVRDFVYVDDAVRAFAAAADLAAAPARPINIGSGVGTSIRDMARGLLELYGRDPSEHDVTGAFRVGDVRHAVADITTAKALLRWEPNVGFAEGLARFAEWAKAGS
jgi:dTDP-L-rhamnose 4-epimerase